MVGEVVLWGRGVWACLVRLDVGAEADVQGSRGGEHRGAVPPCCGDVEDCCRLGDIVDVFADVEVPEFVYSGGESLRDGHVSGGWESM